MSLFYFLLNIAENIIIKKILNTNVSSENTTSKNTSKRTSKPKSAKFKKVKGSKKAISFTWSEEKESQNGSPFDI